MMTWIDPLSFRLRDARWLPWRVRHRGGVFNTLVGAPWRKRRLLTTMRTLAQEGPDDLTVIIGNLNRMDHRLVRALENLRLQRFPQEHLKLVVVDYGNPPAIRQWLETLAARYEVELIRPGQRYGAWSKPHCMNVAIRRVTTKFTMSSDVDILFHPDYLAKAVGTLKKNSLQVIYSQLMDLAADQDPLLADLDQPVDFDALLAVAKPRGGNMAKGMNLTYTHYYHLVRGYDEFFEGWGTDDNDLARRFHMLGLEHRSIADACPFLHQWHPRFEGIPADQVQAHIRRNEAYLAKARKIVVNDGDWGSMTPPAVRPG